MNPPSLDEELLAVKLLDDADLHRFAILVRDHDKWWEELREAARTRSWSWIDNLITQHDDEWEYINE